MKRLDHAGFAGRLAYLRWVRHLEVGEPPTNEAIGKAAEHTGQWLTGLLKEAKAPTKAEDHHAVAAFFGVSGDWLFYNEGAAPRPELWALWTMARALPDTAVDGASWRVEAETFVPPGADPAEVVGQPAAAKKRKRAGGTR